MGKEDFLMSKTKKHLFSLTGTALLTALTVVLSRFFSVNVWNMSIGFSFVPLMLCGALFGPIWGGVCGALADFVGATLFPFGPYFPGFTAVAFLGGVFFGLCGLADRKIRGFWPFILIASALLIIKETVCSLLLNSLWISILYGSPYGAVLISRIPLSAVTVVLEIAFTVVMRLFILPPIKKEMERL